MLLEVSVSMVRFLYKAQGTVHWGPSCHMRGPYLARCQTFIDSAVVKLIWLLSAACLFLWSAAPLSWRVRIPWYLSVIPTLTPDTSADGMQSWFSQFKDKIFAWEIEIPIQTMTGNPQRMSLSEGPSMLFLGANRITSDRGH